MSKFTWIDYSADDTGIKSAPANVSIDMTGIATEGADLVELHWSLVNATGAALDYTANLQARVNQFGTLSSWLNMQTRAIAAGVETWSDRKLAKTSTAAAATYTYKIPIEDINPASQFRLSSLVTTTGGATDLLTITARVRIPTGR